MVRSDNVHEQGWIIKIATRHGRKVNIFVMPTRNQKGCPTYRIHCTNASPPWKYWEGDKSENELYRGDHPDEYVKLREQEKSDGS